MTSKRAKGCSTLLENLKKEPRRQERKPGASFARIRGPARRGPSAATPYRAVRPNELTHPEPGFRIIALFGAMGAIVPLILLSLEKDLTSHLGPDRLLPVLRILIWPASVLAIGMQWSMSASALVLTVLLNVATYLVVGSLVWLGLQRPRSIAYLVIVGIMYLTLVGFAGVCERLLI